MGRLIAVIVVIVISTLLDVLYLFWSLNKNRAYEQRNMDGDFDDKRTWMIFWMMVATPVIGPLFFGGAKLFRHVFFRSKGNLEGAATFDKTRVESRNPANLERDMNLVPMEEALAVSDKGGLRSLMLSVVKGDVTQFLSSIAKALNSEDTETAHYAASVLRDEINNFSAHVTETLNAIAEADTVEKVALCQHLLAYMSVFLQQNVFVGIERENYVTTMEEVGEIYYSTAQAEFTVEEFSWIVTQLMNVGRIEVCQKWCDRMFEMYPTSLQTYSDRLKFYFKTDQQEAFFETLKGLKESRVGVDKETLEIIRMFETK